MDFSIWAQTDVGLKRKQNQDSILVEKKLGLVVVADGMGGHKGGEVASDIAITTAKKIMQDQLMTGDKVNPRDLVEKIITVSNKNIFHEAHVVNTELQGMGTTMVVGIITEKNIYFGNVGDSRAYLYKDKNLWQVTEDHSLINEQIKAGFLSEEESETAAGKNVITRSVGFAEEVDVDVFEREISPGETYMLCSDGLCGLISDQDISDLFQANPIDKVTPVFVEEAKKAGGDDNISVIVVQFK
jgi:PPM family protein phosphatase